MRFAKLALQGSKIAKKYRIPSSSVLPVRALCSDDIKVSSPMQSWAQM